MKLITLICFILFSLQLFSQENLFFKGSQINYYEVDSEFVAISQRPVTNREYIIYLQWMRGVFSPNYPEIFYNSVPGLDRVALQKAMTNSTGYQCDLNMIISFSEPFVKDYMFNPKYLDYPVVGVSWQNANNYGLWLADRYNQNKLIEKGYLNFPYSPTENDYFSTDAYLAGKWQGAVRRYLPSNDKLNPERNFEWRDQVLIPVFRLPIQKEIAIVNKTSGEMNHFKAYPFTKKHFLYKWYKEYFASESDSVVVLWLHKAQGAAPEKITCSKTVSVTIAGEMNLDINNTTGERKLAEIYRQNGQQILNLQNYDTYWKECCAEGLGTNPVIGDDKHGNPVFATKYKDLEKGATKEFKVFRMACSVTPKQLGLKIK